MVRCYDCKHLTNMVQWENRTEIWNKYCQKKEQIVTDTFLDDIQCDLFNQETMEDIIGGMR